MRIYPGLVPAEIYLPSPSVDLTKWAVVACDQFTSQPEYWNRVKALAEGVPSTLHITQPEIDLASAGERIPRIQEAMRAYLQSGALLPRVRKGFVLTERVTESGARLGLIAAVDLEQYDYAPGAKPLIRATEGTITERIPPRMRIREGACLELPHVMLLIDDPEMTAIEPLYERLRTNAPLYDFELMEGGGHLRGWAAEDSSETQALSNALCRLNEASGGFLYAVGDGNHSLATAKACWEALKPKLPEDERITHPARWALCEIVNLHSPALRFEPIHRILFGADMDELAAAFKAEMEKSGIALTPGNDIRFLQNGRETGLSLADQRLLPVAPLQAMLDGYLKEHPGVRIDYVHGERAVREICESAQATGILLGAIDKRALFPSIRKGGVLPRKTFSMGEAHEKRYYMEARKIL